MATCQQPPKPGGSNFTCLNHILLNAEGQTPFYPDKTAITPQISVYFDYKSSPLQSQQQHPLSLGTVR